MSHIIELFYGASLVSKGTPQLWQLSKYDAIQKTGSTYQLSLRRQRRTELTRTKYDEDRT